MLDTADENGRWTSTDDPSTFYCIIFIKMLIPFSKDSIIISNTPEFTRTIKPRNTMEQFLWSQAWIVRYPDHFRWITDN